MAYDPDNTGQFLAVAAYDGNTIYRLNLSDTSGGDAGPSPCTLLSTITVNDLDGIFGDLIAIEYDPTYGGYWVSDWKSNNVALLDKSFNLVRTMTLGQTGFNSGVSPMYNVGTGDPYELWVTDYDGEKTTVVESGKGNEPLADVAVTKDDGLTEYIPGMTITYSVVVSNNGPDTAEGVNLLDTAPGSTSITNWKCFAKDGAVCPNESGTGDINETADLLPAGGELIYTVNLLAVTSADPLENTATVSATSIDNNAANNSATASTDLWDGFAGILKSDGRTTYTPGESVTYVLVVANYSLTPINNFTLTDTEPAGTDMSWTCQAFLGASCPSPATGTGGIDYTTSLTSGQALVFMVDLDIPSSFTGNLVNTAGVSGVGWSMNSASDTDTQLSVADISVTKTDGSDTYTPGTSCAYTLLIENKGPSDANNVDITDSAPSDATIGSWNCISAGGAACPNATGSGDIDETVVSFPVGGSLTYYVIMSTPPGSGQEGGLDIGVSNSVQASGDDLDPVPTNNSATDTNRESRADISVTKTDGVSTYVAGGSTTYTITVGNAGPDDAFNVTIADTAPAYCAITGWTCSESGGAACPNPSGSGDINELVALISVGGSLTYSVDMSIDAGATGTLINTVNANSVIPDPDLDNNSASDANNSPGSSADIAVSKSDGASTYDAGSITTYTVTVSNAGPDHAVNLTVTDTAPSGTTINAWQCSPSSGATCPNSAGTGDLNETPALLQSGESLTYTVELSIGTAFTGSLQNTAVVNSDTPDPNTGNNSATDTNQQPSADISVAKTDGTDTYMPGTSTTYTVTVGNAGPDDADNVTITDTAPSSSAITGWTCIAGGGAACPNAAGSGNIDETAVSFPAGGSLTYTVNMSIDSGATGSLANTASVKSDTSDPNTGNNSATDTNQQPSADISTAKTDGTDTYTPGTSTTYTVTVGNAGPDDADNVTITDTSPSNGAITGWTCIAGGGAACPNAAGSGDIDETAVSFPAGGSLTYTVDMSINSGATGSLANTSSVNSDTPDPNTGNNSATDSNTYMNEAARDVGNPTAVPTLSALGWGVLSLSLLLGGVVMLKSRGRGKSTD